MSTTATPLHAHVFRPPTSPALTPSTDYFSQRSRKRARPGSGGGSGNQYATPADTTSWMQCPTPTDAMYGSACVGGDGLVNERYALKGGLDTPGLMLAGEEVGGMRGGGEFGRRGREGHEMDGGRHTAHLSGPLARERNGVGRLPSSPNGSTHGTSQGWTGLAFSLVGKVFNFSTSVIKGFYAGEGRGYDLPPSSSSTSSPTTWLRARAPGTPIPGSWQDDDDFLGDFEQDNPTPPSRPPNKRRQTDKDSWIIVGTPDLDNNPPSPRRKISSSAIPRSTRPNTLRASATRRSIAPLRRSSAYHTPTTSNLPTPENRRASFAPTRSPHGATTQTTTSNPQPTSRPSSSHAPQSTLTPEVERLLKRKQRADKTADRAMNQMGQQLRDLIAQAQTALGTKYAVQQDGEGEVEMVDEGFVDDEEGEDW